VILLLLKQSTIAVSAVVITKSIWKIQRTTLRRIGSRRRISLDGRNKNTDERIYLGGTNKNNDERASLVA
jgi:hypothetical protein